MPQSRRSAARRDVKERAVDVRPVALEELRIVGVARREIASNAGATSPAEYRQRLADGPANAPGSKEELLARAREDIDRAMVVAPRFFGTLPKAGCAVKAVEEFKEKDAPFADYFPPGDRRLARRDLLRQRLRPAAPEVHEARDDDLPRGGPGPDRQAILVIASAAVGTRIAVRSPVRGAGRG